MSRALSLILAALALAFATLWQGAFDPYKFAWAAAGIAMAALLAFFASRHETHPTPVPLWALIPLMLIPLYVGFQQLPLPFSVLAKFSPRAAELAAWLHRPSAPVSIAPNASLAFTFRLLTALTVFFLTRELASHMRWLVMIPVVTIAVLEAILGLVQATSSVTVLGTYVNRDHFAFLLEISLPFAVMGGISLIKNSRQTRHAAIASALFACATLLLLGIIFSLSRAGFVTALGSLFLVAVLNLKKRLRVRGFALLTAVFIGLLFFLPITPLVLRFSQLSLDESDRTGARHLIWKDALPVLREYPLFGTGLGGFENAIRRHQTTDLLYTIGYAHNEYLQFLAELGLFGLLLFLLPVVWLLRHLVTNLDDPLAKAALASAVAILLHCIVDFNLQVPANLLTVAWVAGAAASVHTLVPNARPAVASLRATRLQEKAAEEELD